MGNTEMTATALGGGGGGGTDDPLHTTCSKQLIQWYQSHVFALITN